MQRRKSPATLLYLILGLLLLAGCGGRSADASSDTPPSTQSGTPTVEPAQTEDESRREQEDQESQPVEESGETRVLGAFVDADKSHQCEGDVILEGDQLTLKNFKVTAGPQLWVYLVKEPNPTRSKDVLADFTAVDQLQKPEGEQTYTLPKDTNINDYGSVVIYCKPFKVLFGIATIQPE